MGRGLARLGGERAHPGDVLRRVAQQHAAAPGGDELVAVEGEDAEAADRSRVAPFVGGAEGLGGVLDERDLVAGADLEASMSAGWP